MDLLPGVKAYIDGITFKSKIENNAKIIKQEYVIGIQYPQVLVQPWPREFSYQFEFFAGNHSPSLVKDQVFSSFEKAVEEHVLYIFSENLNQLIPAYRQLGYLHAWNNILMIKKISPNEKRFVPPGVKIKKITTLQEVSMVNSIGPDNLSSTKGLENPAIHNLMAFYKDEVCAKAQMIILQEKFAFLADIYTHTNYRRKGISNALLQEMHTLAAEAGVKYSVLIPSKMTREFDLFQKHAYRTLVEVALLVPG